VTLPPIHALHRTPALLTAIKQCRGVGGRLEHVAVRTLVHLARRYGSSSRIAAELGVSERSVRRVFSVHELTVAAARAIPKRSWRSVRTVTEVRRAA
jgi:AraC-like DNA-binding protein